MLASAQPLTGTVQPLKEVDALTPAWLSAALGGGCIVEHVRIERIGVGEGLASRLFRLHPSYADARGGPDSLVLKLLTDNSELLRVLNPDVAFREARFYRDLAQQVDQPGPLVYFSEFDTQARCLSILMEDLPGLCYGIEASVAESEAAMCTLARVHARFWQHPQLDAPWLQPVMNTDLDLEWLIPHAIEAAVRDGYGQSHLTRAVRVLETLVPRIAAGEAPPTKARSLCHGDFHRNNSLLQPDGRFVVFDWQMIEAGNPLRDVAYWLLTSLTVEQRRAQQQGLLALYHRTLIAEGVRDYGRLALLQDFRLGMLENLIKVYCIPAVVQADQALLLTLRERVEAASLDMHTIAIAHLMRAVLKLLGWWNGAPKQMHNPPAAAAIKRQGTEHA